MDASRRAIQISQYLSDNTLIHMLSESLASEGMPCPSLVKFRFSVCWMGIYCFTRGLVLKWMAWFAC